MEDKQQVIEQLSKIYNFDIDDALRKLKLTNTKPQTPEKSSNQIKPSQKKKKLILPWSGMVCEDACKGLKLYHKLFIQCSNSVDEGKNYCKGCLKHNLKYGTVNDRLKVGVLDYIDPSGTKVLPYANVMDKLNITKAEVLREADRLNITVPECQFDKIKTRRGRPKKIDTNVSDTDSDTSTDEKKPALKKRGRPKKEKKKVTVDIGDNIAASILNIEKPIKIQEITVTKKTIKGKDYLISISNNKLFDIETHDTIGYWNESTEQIED